MSARFWLAPVVFSAGVLVFPSAQAPAARPTVPAAQDPAPAQDQGQTTLDDQVDLAVTVYNSDLALVRDVRDLRLARGVAELRFMESPQPSTRRPCISVRSRSRRSSTFWSRTTSTTCSSLTNCCASTSAVT